MNATVVAVSLHVRAWRKFRGLTQEELATRVGITRSGLWRIETGKRRPSARTLVKIAGALDIEPHEIFGTPDRIGGV